MAKMLYRITAVLLILLFTLPSYSTVIQRSEGVSAKGVPVIFESKLTIDHDLLTIELSNISTTPSNNPDDLLSSYFFDIYNSIGQRPELILLSARGDVYKINKNSADTLQTASADLRAANSNDKWLFKPMDPSANPYLGFGVGTVGNSKMTPNNFPGNIVGSIEYSIYAGDISSQNLNNKLLVKDSLIFTFSGVNGFAESDILPNFTFGLGTKPDSVLSNIPEPATLTILGVGGTTLFIRKRK
jgi:hypothetical protein